MQQCDYDEYIYNLAYNFLLSFNQIDDSIIQLHINSPQSLTTNLDDVFYRLIESLQNANMKANVIGKSIGGFEKIKIIIPNLQAMATYNNYQDILRDIFSNLKPNSGKSLEEHLLDKNSIWNKYCKSLLSASNFLNQFIDYNDFQQWLQFFNNDDRARPALPMLLSHEIYGLGFALACDFLKEIGCLNFGKPDIHIKDIFLSLNLSSDEKDYFILKDIARIGRNVNKTPYAVDKIFWLIGSGNFYRSGIKIGNQKKAFIKFVENNKF